MSETSRSRRPAALRLGVAAAGLSLLGVLVGVGADASAPAAARPPVTALVVAFRLVLYLAFAMEVTIGAVLVYALWPDRRRGKRRPEDEWEEHHEPPRIHPAVKLAMAVAPLALLIGLFVMALRTGHGSGPLTGAPPLPQPAMPPTVAPPGAAPGGVDTGLIALVIAIAIVGLVGVAVFLLLRRHRAHLARPGRAERAVAAAADDGLEALRRERDPRRAVVLAYASMERALARRGWPRAEAEAPFEYLARLAYSKADPSHLLSLTELFEVARFSEHPVDEPMRAAAVRHLESVRADLEAASSTA